MDRGGATRRYRPRTRTARAVAPTAADLFAVSDSPGGSGWGAPVPAGYLRTRSAAGRDAPASNLDLLSDGRLGDRSERRLVNRRTLWFRRKVLIKMSETIILCDLCSQGGVLLCGSCRECSGVLSCPLRSEKSYPDAWPCIPSSSYFTIGGVHGVCAREWSDSCRVLWPPRLCAHDVSLRRQ